MLEAEGLEPVTVERIVKGVGISRAALYFYFGSKQDLLTALVARTMAMLGEDAELLEREVDEEDPKSTIRHMTERIERQWIDHRIVMRTAVESGPLIPEVRGLWNDTVDVYVGLLTKVLVRAGIPDVKGPTGAAALARALTWMSERNFYIAATDSRPDRAIRRATKTVIAIWWGAMDGNATPYVALASSTK